MKIERLRQQLMQAAARPGPPGEVPPAFTQRVLAAVQRTVPAADPLEVWVTGLWRAAFCCAAIAVLATVGLGPDTPGWLPTPLSATPAFATTEGGAESSAVELADGLTLEFPDSNPDSSW
jgi:hypothetical protein